MPACRRRRGGNAPPRRRPVRSAGQNVFPQKRLRFPRADARDQFVQRLHALPRLHARQKGLCRRMQVGPARFEQRVFARQDAAQAVAALVPARVDRFDAVHVRRVQADVVDVLRLAVRMRLHGERARRTHQRKIGADAEIKQPGVRLEPLPRQPVGQKIGAEIGIFEPEKHRKAFPRARFGDALKAAEKLVDLLFPRAGTVHRRVSVEKMIGHHRAVVAVGKVQAHQRIRVQRRTGARVFGMAMRFVAEHAPLPTNFLRGAPLQGAPRVLFQAAQIKNITKKMSTAISSQQQRLVRNSKNRLGSAFFCPRVFQNEKRRR